MSKSLCEKNISKLENLIDELETLSVLTGRTGILMEKLGKILPNLANRGGELIGAADIMDEWISCMKAELPQDEPPEPVDDPDCECNACQG